MFAKFLGLAQSMTLSGPVYVFPCRCVLLRGRVVKALKPSMFVILCNNYIPASHFEFYLNHVCLGNKNLSQEIDVGTCLLHNI